VQHHHTLASSGYAATPEAPAMDDAASANVVQVETSEAATVATNAGKRDLRENAEEEVGANKASEGTSANNKKRGLKNEDPSGQTYSGCCNDDFHCKKANDGLYQQQLSWVAGFKESGATFETFERGADN
jgi:hypothetical protein